MDNKIFADPKKSLFLIFWLIIGKFYSKFNKISKVQKILILEIEMVNISFLSQ